MRLLILPISALLLGTIFLLVGSGLLNTLLALRGSLEGFSDQTLGLIMSAYFIGYFIGTFLALPMIRRIGHIRAFACCASLLACFALLHAIFTTSLMWFVLRLFTGTALVALYTIIESWLNGQSPSTQRGQVFAVYMVVNLSALALAQPLIVLASPAQFILFSLAAILISLSLVPITWTRLAQPELSKVSSLSPRYLIYRAPVAAYAAFLSGLAMGAFWGLGAVFAQHISLSKAHIAWFISATIIGGILLQYPLGRFSDTHDRRKVLLFSSLIASLSAILMALLALFGHWILLAAVLYGSAAFAIYPLAVAHLMDEIESYEILAGGSALLLIYGLGCALGPAIAGQLMQSLSHLALPVFFAVTHAVLALYIVYRLSVRKARTVLEPTPFTAMVRTTPTALELLTQEQSSL